MNRRESQSSAAGGPSAQEWTLNPEALGRFLTRLDRDVVEAGRKYERLRFKLVRLFEWRRCVFAEDLADETVNRVIRLMDNGLELSPAEIPRYACGVAQKVHLEHLRAVKRAKPSAADSERAPFVPGIHETTDLRLHCLNRCVEELPQQDRELIMRYYTGDHAERIRRRKELAEELGLAPNTLRIRAHRIRSRLEKAIEAAMHRDSEEGHHASEE